MQPDFPRRQLAQFVHLRGAVRWLVDQPLPLAGRTALRRRDSRGADPAKERAFGQRYGPRLNGFALLLTLGDERAAAAAAWKALAIGSRKAGRGHRPSRPAAWLRRRVLRTVDAPWKRLEDFLRGGTLIDAERRGALRWLGASGALLDGLAALSRKERAALIAATAEGLDEESVRDLLGVRASAARRVLERARRRYLSAAGAVLDGDPLARRERAGPIAQRVRRAARELAAVPAATSGMGPSDHRPIRVWLAAGAPGTPSATAAAHAAECSSCANRIMALDSLRAVQTARPEVPLPGMGPAPLRADGAGPWRAWARAVAGPALLIGVALTGVMGPIALSEPGLLGSLPGGQLEGPAGIVIPLPGATTPTPGAPADDDAQPGPSGTQSGAPQPSLAPALGPLPTDATGDSPIVPGSTAAPSSFATSPPSDGGSPAPNATPLPAPSATPPPATPEPTSPPTPEPVTPEPTPGSILPECTDLIDNDGDGLIDLLDPDCLDLADLTEG